MWLNHLRSADRIDFATVHRGHEPCLCRRLGLINSFPSFVDRSKLGSKHAILTDGQGVPLVIDTIPANTPDVNQAVPLVDAVPSDRRQARPPPGNARTM